MPVAVVSDIHGNLPALRAVLAEIEALGVERIVCCGDIASGPLPRETVDFVMALDGRFLSVKGNADRGAVESFDGRADPDVTHEDDLWAGRQLETPQRDYLAALPTTLSVDLEGLGSVLFCHGTPRRDDEIVLETTPQPHVEQMLAGVAAPTVVCGNTHMPFARTVGARRLVNAGSVGWPYGDPGAHWALLGPDVVFRCTAYDRAAAAAELRRTSRWPRLETFIENVVLEPVDRLTARAFFERAAASAAARERGRGDAT